MDLDYFLKEEGEDLKNKSAMLDDFMNAASDRCFCMKDLYTKFEKMESFLKRQEPFPEQCMDLKRKNDFIEQQVDSLQEFIKVLEEIQKNEKLLSFDPVTEPYKKLETLQDLKKVHLKQLAQSEAQSQDVEDSLVAYNEIVDSISEKI